MKCSGINMKPKLFILVMGVSLYACADFIFPHQANTTQELKAKLEAIIDLCDQTLANKQIADTQLIYQKIHIIEQKPYIRLSLNLLSHSTEAHLTECKHALELVQQHSILTHLLRELPQDLYKQLQFTAQINSSQFELLQCQSPNQSRLSS